MNAEWLTAYNNEFDTQEFQIAFNYVRSVLPVLREKIESPFVNRYPRGLFPSSMRHMAVDERLVQRWRSRSETHVG